MTDITNVSSAAGYYIVWPASDREGYRRLPVVAWRGERFGYPVATQGPETFPEDSAILCPDGSVNQMDGGDWWPSVRDWLEALRPGTKHKTLLVG